MLEHTVLGHKHTYVLHKCKKSIALKINMCSVDVQLVMHVWQMGHLIAVNMFQSLC